MTSSELDEIAEVESQFGIAAGVRPSMNVHDLQRPRRLRPIVLVILGLGIVVAVAGFRPYWSQWQRYFSPVNESTNPITP
jgi:hypothetical protein